LKGVVTVGSIGQMAFTVSLTGVKILSTHYTVVLLVLLLIL